MSLSFYYMSVSSISIKTMVLFKTAKVEITVFNMNRTDVLCYASELFNDILVHANRYRCRLEFYVVSVLNNR